VHLLSIETHGEWVLASLAEKYPEKVFDFFVARLQYKETREEGERYEDIPFQFECLQKSFVRIAEHAVATVRKWFVSGDSMFQFRGGRLLAISFPDFAEPFSRKLLSLAETGHRADVEFVLRVFTNYHGQTFLHEICKAIVKALPDDDPFLTDVEIILESTDVLTGEFGRVHAYTAKKQEVADWLADTDARVNAFAKRYTLLLDRQIRPNSDAQRRASSCASGHTVSPTTKRNLDLAMLVLNAHPETATEIDRAAVTARMPCSEAALQIPEGRSDLLPRRHPVVE
jgi:hypothetical protein